MRYRIRTYLKAFDWPLLASIILLTSFGLTEIYSVALGQGANDLLNFYKQIAFIGLGIILLFIFTFIDFRFLKSIRKYLYIFAVSILTLVLIFGTNIRGTKGWFSIFGLGIQPVEIVKVLLLIFLAAYLSDSASKIKTLRHFLMSALSTIFLMFLVILQNDFGSAVIIGSIWLVLILIVDFPKKYIFSAFSIILVLFVLAWSFFFSDHQKGRIFTFLRPGENVLAEDYNVQQAIIAVGSGNWYGKGVGFGSQSQLKFLPEAQTDFIFAVIAEELGFLGSFLLIIFFGLFFTRLIKHVRKLNNDFSIYFILGSAGLIFIQMFINIGMNIGLMPVVGIALPFVSYGGSAIISLFILVGIIQNIIIKSKINY